MTAGFKAIASGRVQGVGYRYFARATAERLGASGTVKNLPGGDVEIVARGKQEILEKFLDELRRGPAGARVSGVSVDWNENGDESPGFRIEF